MAISLVQSKVGTWASPSVSLNSNTTAGNCVVLMLTSTNGVTATSAAKLGGAADNFTKLQEEHQTGTDPGLSSIWADPNCAGGQTAITWTDTGSVAATAYWIAEFSGIALTSAVDTGNVGSGGSGSWSVAFTSTFGTELWLGVVENSIGTAAGSAGHGWTFISQTDSSSNGSAVFGWQAVSSIGTATFSGTGSSLAWGACVAGLKAGGAFMPDPNPGPNQAVMRSAVW